MPLLLLFLTALPLSAQDPVFSQFYAAPLRLNPALAGIGAAPRLTVNYRTQHTSYPSAFVTMAASYEQPVAKTPSSFGVRFMSDRQLEGAYRNTEAALVYSYDVQFTPTLHARLGLAAGILNTSLDFSRLTFGDILDPVTGSAEGTSREILEAASNTSADFGAGVVVYGGSHYGGVSFEHINRPDENLFELNNQLYSGRPQRLTLTAGSQIDLKSISTRKRPAYVTPNILYVGQAKLRQLTLGSYFGYGPLAIGGWYRHAFENADGFITAVSFRQDILRVGFSYDAVVSDLRNVPGGLGATFEVSVMIDFADSDRLKKNRFRRRYSECFRMFQ
ncbi:PorP/SprF family type IX secretion system membrane protein [Neolewinella antarctica]|uniref:Type IX secretion system PorP/SprF family membrane protein n=1 Tax=Neolewinella antarctica TaxID=442734 RepID=A0ABX0XA42_9BACT|nr:PorP/SprF family type IX secretion system membrane protein [Neolewinella antarctica]NJC25828.1 type IX secretion system PorP/SprF family membrane protein [Neolewinella antarctica]